MQQEQAQFRISKVVQSINPSLLLFLAALAAIIFANSPWQAQYFSFLNNPIKVNIGDYGLFEHHGRPMTLQEFVNDALMAIFFFVIGLEIKMELLIGQLSSVRKAMLPVVAAIGGMIIPVLVFYAFVHDGGMAMRGAAIPMATDIAFALAVLAAVGKHVPPCLKVFLMSLAVVDDIGGIIIIALFYSGQIHLTSLLIGLGLLVVTYILGRKGMDKAYIYYFIGFIVWTFFLHSGIHTTISGVLLALTIPSKCTVRLPQLKESLSGFVQDFNGQYEIEAERAQKLSHRQLVRLRLLEKKVERSISPLQFIEHDLSPVVSYIILPLFAFVNAGVTFGGVTMSDLLGLPIAIFCGLFMGKMLGISLFTYIPNKIGILKYPEGMTTRNLIAISIFGGIGFTVSLFIASLSYSPETAEGVNLLNQAKIGVFSGTIVSALVGFFALNFATRHLKK